MVARKRLGLLLLMSAAGVSLTPSVPARACGNTVRYHKHRVVRSLQRAESELRKGKLETAARQASLAFPKLVSQGDSATLLELRAARIMARVTVRSGGAWLDEGWGLVRGSKKEIAQNHRWALRRLRGRVATDKKNALYQNDLGEALAAMKSHHREALSLLEALADKELLTSPYAHAALARMRREAGDVEGAQEQQNFCESRATSPTMCSAPEDYRLSMSSSKRLKQGEPIIYDIGYGFERGT